MAGLRRWQKSKKAAQLLQETSTTHAREGASEELVTLRAESDHFLLNFELRQR